MVWPVHVRWYNCRTFVQLVHMEWFQGPSGRLMWYNALSGRFISAGTTPKQAGPYGMGLSYIWPAHMG